MDQVYFFYKYCRKAELAEYKMNAIVLANALVYTSPSSDRSGVSSKQKTWDKFIDSLDWDSMPKDKKTQSKNVLGMFKKLGMVPILNKKG